MFKWDESTNRIDVPASKVVHLFRSMRDVQLALPGISAQQASAYLCQYKTAGGIATVAVFHLHKSKVMAFYFSDPQVVPEPKMDNLLDQGLNFVESMGFLLTDQDIHLLDDSDRQMLWESLPLKAGIDAEPAPAEPAPVPPSAGIAAEQPADRGPASGATAEQNESVVKTIDRSPAKAGQPSSAVAVRKPEPKQPEQNASADNVDDLLAAVEAMRAKRPGLRARTLAPSAEEMERRKEQLRENVGRILASL